MTKINATELMGKTVTLMSGPTVATVVGVGVRNGLVDEGIAVLRGDDGQIYQVLSRVVHELPMTHRRATLPAY